MKYLFLLIAPLLIIYTSNSISELRFKEFTPTVQNNQSLSVEGAKRLLCLISCNNSSIKGDLVIANVNIVDIRNSQIIYNQHVVILGDRISLIASGDHHSIQADTLIDGTNLYVIPGLWDMHVHIRQFEDTFFPLFIAHGVTGIRDMFNPVIDEIGAWKDSVNQSGDMNPKIGLVGGRVVDAHQERNWPGSIVLEEQSDIKEFVIDVAKAKGYDFIKVYSSLSLSQLEEIAEEAHKAGLPFAGHLPVGVPIQQAIALGQKSIEHLEGFHISMSTHQDSLYAEISKTRDSLSISASFTSFRLGEAFAAKNRDEEKIKELMALLRENKVFPSTAIFTMMEQRLKSPHEYIDRNRFGFDFYPDSLVRQFSEQLVRSYPPDLVERLKTTYVGNLQLIYYFEKYEVPFLAGTDASPTRPVLPGKSLHQELQLMQESGVKPVTLLKSATLFPAMFMQAEDKYGSVEEGKVADLVLLYSNPLEDLANAEQINGVILNGKFHSTDELESTLKKIKRMANHSSGKETNND